MREEKRFDEQGLKEVVGGFGGYDDWRTVCNLNGGYLAIRTQASYDFNTEIEGAQLVNGDQVQITGSYIPVGEHTYVWIYSPKFGVSGYVDADYLGF